MGLQSKIRFYLWISLLFVATFLYYIWQSEHNQKNSFKITLNQSQGKISAQDELPQIDTFISKNVKRENIPTSTMYQKKQDLIFVETDVLKLHIDLKGGDIVHLSLPKYPASKETPEQGFILMNESAERFYVSQLGLLHPKGPDSKQLGRAQYHVSQNHFKMKSGKPLTVQLKYNLSNGVLIIKEYLLEPESYLIRSRFIVENKGEKPYQTSLYGRLKRKSSTDNNNGAMGMRTYTGGVIKTDRSETSYQKITFNEMDKGKLNQSINGGWLAMVEQYFVSVLVPDDTIKHQYTADKLSDNVYALQFVSEPINVASGQIQTFETKIYTGPEVASKLKVIAPGLEKTIDYGIFWPIAWPIFLLLKEIYKWVGNWGLAIISTTLIIKVMFYHLSASSYRSMGKLKNLQPKIEVLKKRCGDDRQQFGQEIIALYRKEKVNPLGGCLPVLIQIPVFIALYWVLLESVELRQAPFYGWIHDLSAQDPYYILPIIMGFTMLIQQKLGPAPPDPVQAKVMMAMPIIFTFLFLKFPAGLVLYWIINNILSILQQRYITRNIKQEERTDKKNEIRGKNHK